MGIHVKTLLIFSLAVVMLFGLVTSLATYVVLRQFTQLELAQMEREAGLIQQGLRRELGDLEALAAQAARDPSLRSAQPALPAGSLRGERAFALLLGGSQEVRSLGPGPVSPSLTPALRKGGFSPSGPSGGFLEVDGRLVLAASAPVPGAGRSGLSLVLGRWFSPGSSPDPQRPPAIRTDFLAAGAATAAGLGIPGTQQSSDLPFVSAESDQDLQAFIPLRDPAGRAIGFLQVEAPRWLYPEGRRAVRLFLVSLALVGGLLFFITWFLLDWAVLSRIKALGRRLEEARDRGEAPDQLHFGGSDELAGLARRFEQLAKSLRRAEASYRAIVEDQTEFIARYLPDGTLTFVNGAVCRLLGRPAAEINGTSMFQWISPAEARRLQRDLARISPHLPLLTSVHSLKAADGQTVWIERTDRGFFDPSGRLLESQMVARDITTQREVSLQLRRLSGRLLQLQDEERRRIARELHDSTAQNLTALGMNLGLLEQSLGSGTGDPLGYAREARELAELCGRELRTISYLLHPPLLDEVGLVFALQWFAEGFTSRTGIKLELDLPGDLGRLPKEVETTLFRVVQEALTNIHRHAQCDSALLRLQTADGEINLTVIDRGQGMTPEQLQAIGTEPGLLGVGLSGMRERLSQLDGTLDINSGPEGTTIRATVPQPAPHGREED